MIKNKLLPALMIGTLLTTSLTFADNNTTNQKDSVNVKPGIIFSMKDPSLIKPLTEAQQNKLLEDFTKMLDKQVESGTITKDDKDRLLANFKMSIGNAPAITTFGMDALPAAPAMGFGIAADGVFEDQFESDQKLTLAERKEKMLDNLTEKMKKAVEEGAITQADADKAINDFKKQLESWDGTKPLMFGLKNDVMMGKPFEVERIGLEDMKSLTVSEKVNKILGSIKDKLGNWDGSSPVIFEIGTPDVKPFMGAMGTTSMRLDMKGLAGLTPDLSKDQILQKVTDFYNNMVKEGSVKQEEANKKIAEIKEQLKNWDGKSPIRFEFKVDGNSKDITIQLK